MKKPRLLSFAFDHAGDCTAVSGRDAYPVLVSVGARPLWSAQSKAWCTNIRRGEEALVIAQERHYIVACEVLT